jgi:general secretion pathway protein H
LLRADWPHAGREAGFTLIEMIVVMAVLGLVAGLVLVRGPPRSAALEMRAAANAVAQTLRVARTRAIMSNQRVTVALDPRAATLRIGAGTSRGLPAGVTMSVITAADLTSAQAGASAQAGIAFLPDGSSSGGRVELATGARRMQVGVDWLTGRVSVADGP